MESITDRAMLVRLGHVIIDGQYCIQGHIWFFFPSSSPRNEFVPVLEVCRNIVICFHIQ